MKNFFILLLVFVFMHTMVIAQADEDTVRRLESIVAQQQTQIEALQGRLQTLEEDTVAPQPMQVTGTNNAYAEEVVREYIKSPEAQEEGAEFGYENGRGFFVRVPDFELYLSGAIQMGVGIFENDTPDNNNVFANEVMLATDVFFYKREWHARIELNFHDAPINMFQANAAPADGIHLWDAYVEYLGMQDEFGNPLIALKVGQFHVPFSIAGQWNPTGGPTIWSPPFINGWAHGRDPGLMLWGVLSDMVEYRLSVHNGEGATTTNGSDDFLMAGNVRIYPFKKSENSDFFFHVGAIRSRDNRFHNSNDVAAASLTTPWLRPVFGGTADLDGDGSPDGADSTMGWRTGVDAGLSGMMDLGDDGINSLYVEGEFMYLTWERNFTSIGGPRCDFLRGYGASLGFVFKHNLTPEIKGAGIFPVFQFSYSDVDNTSGSDSPYDIPGQRVFTYTFGLGYSFNEHITAQFNWVMVDLDEHDAYNARSAAKNNASGSDDTEHAWFLQFTAVW